MLNEEDRISAVLETLINIKFLDEIIVVDDGSTDSTPNIVEEFIPRDERVRFIQNKSNQGKSNAVIKGVKLSSSEYIVLLDSDLNGLRKKHVELLILPLLLEDYDMTNMVVEGDSRFLFSSFGTSILFTGQRAMKRRDFLNCKIPVDSGYRIEGYLNDCFIKRDKKILAFVGYGVSDRSPYSRYSFIKSLRMFIGMLSSLYRKFDAKVLHSQFNSIYWLKQNIFNRVSPRDFYEVIKNDKRINKLRSGLLHKIILTIWGVSSVLADRILKAIFCSK